MSNTKPNSSQITYDSGLNKQDLNNILDTVVPIEDYAVLRLYNGRATQVRVTADGIAGFFKLVTTGDDNGGTVIRQGSTINGDGTIRQGTGDKRWKRVFDGAVNVKWFGADSTGVNDSTGAFIASFITDKKVYAPSGTYLTDIQTMPSNAYLFGDGGTTIIKPLTINSRSALGTLPAANHFISNITLRDIRFLGEVATAGFSEQNHLAAFNGVDGLYIERVIFEGFRGDGLYIGTGNGDNLERHNKNVIVKECVFDGINNDNRQGISVTDVDEMLVEGCSFKNCTRSNMPGAIDFEPDSKPYTVVRNVKVVNNHFYNVGGNVGVVAFFFVTPETWIKNPHNFIVDNNTFENCNNTPLFAGLSIVSGTANDLKDQNFIFSNNTAVNCQRFAVQIFNTKNLKLTNNTFYKITNGALFGYDGGTSSIDTFINGNSFIECGWQTGSGFGIFNALRMTIDNNLFKDCGSGAGACALDFCTNSTTSYVSITNNVITSPKNITKVAIQKQGTHTLTPQTNAYFGNTVINSGFVFFTANNSDSLETIYTPNITGATTAGTGTYTSQMGRWRRLGNQVFFWVDVACSAHTGTGTIQVGLPINSTTNSGLWTSVTLTVSGVTTTGGHVGMINPNLLVNGNSAVRAYQTGTGTLTSIAIPAGAFRVMVAGTYSCSG